VKESKGSFGDIHEYILFSTWNLQKEVIVWTDMSWSCPWTKVCGWVEDGTKSTASQALYANEELARSWILIERKGGKLRQEERQRRWVGSRPGMLSHEGDLCMDQGKITSSCELSCDRDHSLIAPGKKYWVTAHCYCHRLCSEWAWTRDLPQLPSFQLHMRRGPDSIDMRHKYKRYAHAGLLVLLLSYTCCTRATHHLM